MALRHLMLLQHHPANSYSLDLEAGQYASIADASQAGLDITGDITIECWYRPESQPATDTMATLVSKWDSANQRSYLFSYEDLGGVISLSLWTTADGSTNSLKRVAQTLSNATWYHLAVAYTASSGAAEFYVDGASIGTDTDGGAIHAGSAAFYVGARGTGFDYADGLIDEVRVWNTRRTAGQISADKRRDVTGQANLQGYWKLNNGYTDSSGNGNTLTASGGPVFSTTVPFVSY